MPPVDADGCNGVGVVFTTQILPGGVCPAVDVLRFSKVPAGAAWAAWSCVVPEEVPASVEALTAGMLFGSGMCSCKTAGVPVLVRGRSLPCLMAVGVVVC